MQTWNQELLDQIHYMHVMGALPKDISEMYLKLPKKKDNTLNMQLSNKSCYTFIALISLRDDFTQPRHRMFGLYPELKHTEGAKEAPKKDDTPTERISNGEHTIQLKIDKITISKIAKIMRNIRERMDEFILLIEQVSKIS